MTHSKNVTGWGPMHACMHACMLRNILRNIVCVAHPHKCVEEGQKQ